MKIQPGRKARRCLKRKARFTESLTIRLCRLLFDQRFWRINRSIDYRMKVVYFAAAVLSIFISAACKSAPRGQTQAPPGENYPNLTARANELSDALERKDYAKVVDLTYPKVIEYA